MEGHHRHQRQQHHERPGVDIALVPLRDAAAGHGVQNPVEQHKENPPAVQRRDGQHIHYRQIDGVVLSQSSGGKFQEGWEKSGSYNKQMWPGECIEFRINDDGIVGFDYLAPLEITETVVDGAALESFDQVKSTFEQMLPITLGSTEYSQTVDVDRVRLSYSRISEKDSFDTGLVVPVWSFEGTDSSYDEESLVWMQSGTLLAINAIDGSVIDGELGY